MKTGLTIVVLVALLLPVESIYDAIALHNRNFDSGPDVCSREQSRRVRHFIDSSLLNKFATSFKHDLAELPEACLLNPERDLFRDQERHKLQTSTAQWDCLICRKKFKSEYYLDRHMKLYHSEKLRNGTVGASPVCLGDMCPIFGCQLFKKTSRSGGTDLGGSVSSYQLHQREKADVRSFEEIHTCTQEEVSQLQDQCRQLMSSCFHGHADMLHYAERTVCELLSCDGGVLKGSLKDAVDEEGEISTSLWIFQAICLIIGGMFFVVYMCTSGSLGIPGAKLTRGVGRSGHDESRRSKFQSLHYAPTTSRGIGRSMSGAGVGAGAGGAEAAGWFQSLVDPVKKELRAAFKASKD